MVHADHNIKVIAERISRGIIAYALILLVGGVFLAAFLVDVEIDAGHLREVDHVGVGVGIVPRARDDEFSGVLVDKHLRILTVAARHMERRNGIAVFLTVGKLLADLLHGAAAPVGKPG